MIAILSFIVAACVILGGGLVALACVIVALTWGFFLATDRISDGPAIRRLESWLSWMFLVGAILCAVACVGILFLAVLS